MKQATELFQNQARGGHAELCMKNAFLKAAVKIIQQIVQPKIENFLCTKGRDSSPFTGHAQEV